MPLLDAIYLRLNDLRNRFSGKRFPAENILLHLPHCLQNRECPVRLKHDLFLCRSCGKCKMKDLKELARRLGVQTYIASGGREALDRTRQPDVKAIIAVACKRELAEGIRGAFPTKVVGVYNTWPHGACKDTDVDTAAVETALRALINNRIQNSE